MPERLTFNRPRPVTRLIHTLLRANHLVRENPELLKAPQIYLEKGRKDEAALADLKKYEELVRALITKDSEKQLRSLAIVHPNETRRFIKWMVSLYQVGIVPERITIPQSVSISTLAEMSGGMERLAGRIFQKGSLDLTPRTQQEKSPLHDLTEGFIDIKLIRESRELLFETNRTILERDALVAATTLYDCLLDVNSVLMMGTADKGVGKLMDDKARLDEGRFQVWLVADFLKDVLRCFPWEKFEDIRAVISSPKAEKLGLLELLEAGNNIAGDPKFDKLLSDLGKMIEQLDRQNAQAGSGRRGSIKSRLEQDVLKYAQKVLGIGITPDGEMTIRQAVFEKRGLVKVKKLVRVKVEEDAAPRRSQHQIDGITDEISDNIGFRETLEKHYQASRNGEIKLEEAVAELKLLLEKFQRYQVVSKKRARSRIAQAIGNLEIAADRDISQPARERLTRDASIMLLQAIRHLNIRNRELDEGQLPRLEIKREAVIEIVAQKLIRDFKLQADIKEIYQSIWSDLRMWKPKDLGEARNLAVAVKKELKEVQEPGLVRVRERMSWLSNNIAKLRRLIIEKYKAVEEFGKLPRTGSFRAVVSKIKYLTDHNLEIKKARRAIIQALIEIQYDLENKHTETGSNDSYLATFQDVFWDIEKRDSDYVMAMSRENPPRRLGKILRRDARKLNLKTEDLPRTK